MSKFRLLNDFITEKGERHPKGDEVELNEKEIRVGLDFRAIEPIEDVTVPEPTKIPETAKSEVQEVPKTQPVTVPSKAQVTEVSSTQNKG